MPTWVAILISASVVAGVAVGRWLWKLAEWKGRVNTDRDNFKAFMKEIRSRLDQIFIRLPPPGLSTNESPVVLNELGKKVSEAMGIKVWAEKTAPTFLEKVEGWKEHRVYGFLYWAGPDGRTAGHRQGAGLRAWLSPGTGEDGLRHRASGTPYWPFRRRNRASSLSRHRRLSVVGHEVPEVFPGTTHPPRKNRGMLLRIQIIVARDGRGFHAYCPAFKGIHMYGRTEQEALDRAKDGVLWYLRSLDRHDDPIPVGLGCVIDEPAEMQIPRGAVQQNMDVRWPLATV